MVERRAERGSQERRSPSTSTSHQAGGKREKTGTGRETGVEVQTYIPDGLTGALRGSITGALRGVVTGVEVGAEINLTGTKGPSTPETGNPLIQGAQASLMPQPVQLFSMVELKMNCIFQIQ